MARPTARARHAALPPPAGERAASACERLAPDAIPAVGGALERLADLGMAHRLARIVGQQVLLRHIGDVLAVRVLGVEVVERLILGRTDLGWNRAPPLLG